MGNGCSNIIDPIKQRKIQVKQKLKEQQKKVDRSDLIKFFIRSLPRFNFTEERFPGLFFTGDEITDINNEMLAIRSKNYTIIIPFINKRKAFDNGGFDCSSLLNLINKDILVVLKLPNNQTRFRFFSLRKAIIAPNIWFHYTLEFRQREQEFFILPWVTMRNDLPKPQLVPLYSWKLFPGEHPSEPENSHFKIAYNCTGFDYDISRVTSEIQEFLKQQLAPSPPYPTIITESIEAM